MQIHRRFSNARLTLCATACKYPKWNSEKSQHPKVISSHSNTSGKDSLMDEKQHPNWFHSLTLYPLLNFNAIWIRPETKIHFSHYLYCSISLYCSTKQDRIAPVLLHNDFCETLRTIEIIFGQITDVRFNYAYSVLQHFMQSGTQLVYKFSKQFDAKSDTSLVIDTSFCDHMKTTPDFSMFCVNIFISC